MKDSEVEGMIRGIEQGLGKWSRQFPVQTSMNDEMLSRTIRNKCSFIAPGYVTDLDLNELENARKWSSFIQGWAAYVMFHQVKVQDMWLDSTISEAL